MTSYSGDIECSLYVWTKGEIALSDDGKGIKEVRKVDMLEWILYVQQ